MRKYLTLVLAVAAFVCSGSESVAPVDCTLPDADQYSGQGESKHPLFEAARLDDSVLLKRLIAEGAYLSVRDSLDDTPLHRAARSGHVRSIEILATAGADLNATNKVLETPLISGVHQPSSVRALIRAGANIHLTDDRQFDALIEAAGDKLAVESVKLLIEAGANVNSFDRASMTPLIVAAQHVNVEAVKLLLHAGANINAQSTWGWKALQFLPPPEPAGETPDAKQVSKERNRAIGQITALLREAGAK